MKTVFAAALICALAGAASAQPVAGSGPAAPERIPSSGGEVILPHPADRGAYDAYHFAAARRVGNTLYVSGVVAAKAPGQADEVEAYKAGLRHAFRRIERTLKAAGADFDDVVMINTFHVWDSPHFKGSKDEHFAAFAAVKDEFMGEPHPAWTAVGTTGLLVDAGLVEIQLIVHLPEE